LHISVTQEFLAAALARGAAVAPKKSAIQILGHVRIVANGESVAVATTDLDRFAEAHCEANVIEPGAVTVPAPAFVALIGKHPKDGEIHLETDGAVLIVKCGRSTIKLPTLPADEFPKWADAKPACEFVMSGDMFERTFNRVRFAASSNEIQYNMQGVCLDADADADVLRLAATDGNQLAVCTTPLPEGAADCPRVVVPTEAVDIALRIFKGANEVLIALTERAISFTADGLRLSCKLIDGKFPDYRRVIPDKGSPGFSLKRADFVDCLDRANVLVGENAYYVIVAEPDGPTLRLLSRNSSGGEAEEELAADIHPEFKRFGFNPRYVASFLSTLAVDELTVEQTDPNGPHLFYSPQAPDFAGVLTPVRI
jgi:DNA polymerase III subunit beta